MHGSVQEKGHRRHRRRPSRGNLGNNGRSRGLHPVSLNFGRPQIEDFIAETIQGTAVVAEWAGQQQGPKSPTEPDAQPAGGLRQVTKLSSTIIEAYAGAGGVKHIYIDMTFA